MALIEDIEKAHIAELAQANQKSKIPDFAPGDTLKVNVRVLEGARARIQAFEGVCIAHSGAHLSESFTLRKISHNIGVERVFLLNSPIVESIQVMRRGHVRRAKLYYLRGLQGKAARIPEKRDTKLEKKTATKNASKKIAKKTAIKKKPVKKKAAKKSS